MKLINSMIARTGRIIILLLSIAISILMSRLYGVEMVGQYTYLMTTITILVLLIVFGTNQSILSNFSKETIPELVGTNIKLYIFTFSSIFFLTMALHEVGLVFDDKSQLFIFLVLIISFLQSITNIFKSSFVVEDKIHLYYYMDMLQYLLIIAGIVLFYIFGYKQIVYMLLYVYIIFGTVIIWINRKNISLINTVKSTIKKEYFISSFVMFISTLLLMLSYKYNIFIFEEDFSKEILGYYAIVMFLIDGITLFLVSIMFADINKFKNAENVFLLWYIGKFMLVSLIVIGFVDLFGYKLLQMVYHVSALEVKEMLSIMKYSIGVVILLKIVQNYFLMNKLYKYYLVNAISFIAILLLVNYFNAGTFENVLFNYITSLCATTLFAIMLYTKVRQGTSHVV